MNKTKKLIVVADNIDKKLSSNKQKYGGKGKFELPNTHIAAMEVTKGGSCCKNCKFVNSKLHECNNEYYFQWNGDSKKLPDLPLDQICSDWWEAK